MTALYFGALVIGVDNYTATTATIFVTMPEALGRMRIEDTALTDIEVLP